MCKKISIEVEDGLVSSIGVGGEWITFHTEDGDEITLEKYTLERGLACYVASQPSVQDGSATCRCEKCGFDYPVPPGCVCPYCGN